MALLTILTNHSSNQCVHKRQHFGQLTLIFEKIDIILLILAASDDESHEPANNLLYVT